MKNKFWTMSNKGKKAKISIYGDIGESFWSESVSARQFKEELDALGEITDLEIYINSPGGSVFDGLAIYNTLKRHAANKTVYIDGLAASAASFIAMAADSIVMPKNAYLMIHNASIMAYGNANDFKKAIDLLNKADATIRDIYQEKTKMSITEITQLMDAETWMTGEDAYLYGFIDEIEDTEITAKSEGGFFMFNSLSVEANKFKNCPLKNQTTADEKPTVTVVDVYKNKLNILRRTLQDEV
jgi:ATP-dependent Clp protease protease subunit